MDDTVTAGELADLLGVDARTVRDLAARGLAQRAGRGRYALRASVRAYVASLRETASGRAGSASLTAERAREATSRADLLALRVAAARRELVPAAEVEAEWSAVMRGIQARMLALPTRAQGLIPFLTARETAILADEIRSALTVAGQGASADE